jgi:hypothetical protein
MSDGGGDSRVTDDGEEQTMRGDDDRGRRDEAEAGDGDDGALERAEAAPETPETPEDARARLNRLVEAGYLRLYWPEGAMEPVYLPTPAGARVIGQPPELVPRGDPGREEVARRLTLVDLAVHLTGRHPGAEWLTPTQLEVEARRQGVRLRGRLAAGELCLPAPGAAPGAGGTWGVEVALTDPTDRDAGRIADTLRRWRRHRVYDRVLYFARGARAVRRLRSLVRRLGLADWVTVGALPAGLPDRLKAMGSPLAQP